MVLTFGSLFAGIGGMDLGLERAGLTCRWQVEIDDYCRRVLTKHWPDVPKYGDIREVSGEGLERVDLICGGFPCQDISNAGKRAGIDGERSGLWSEYIRLVRVLRPRYVLVENVAALLGRGIDRVLGDLAACGYDAEWDCIPAAAVGAPHRRDRLFIVAYSQCSGGEAGAERGRWEARANIGGSGAWPDVADADCLRQLQPQGCIGQQRRRAGDSGAELADTARGGWDGAPAPQPREHQEWQSSGPAGGRGIARSHLPHADRQGLAVGPCFGGNAREELAAFERSCRTGAGIWQSEPPVGRVADGIPGRVDRLRGLGNAVVPQVAEFIGRRILATA